jgi:hypothetical protein
VKPSAPAVESSSSVKSSSTPAVKSSSSVTTPLGKGRLLQPEEGGNRDDSAENF